MTHYSSQLSKVFLAILEENRLNMNVSQILLSIAFNHCDAGSSLCMHVAITLWLHKILVAVKTKCAGSEVVKIKRRPQPEISNLYR